MFEDEASKTGRVVVIEVPPRPVCKVFKFEDVPLMRVGEDLLPMDDKTYLTIIQEQEPDFSEQFCDEAIFDDLDPEEDTCPDKSRCLLHRFLAYGR